jgi:site-specific DNA-methyltransferase (adenine-specific)
VKPFYDDGCVTIYHGDCRDVLPCLGPVDAVVTDPPYGVEFERKATKHRIRAATGYMVEADTPGYVESVVVPVIVALRAGVGRMVVTPGIRNVFRYPEPDALGTIFYPSGAGLGKWGFTCSQPILYYGKCPYLATGQGHRPDSFSTVQPSEDNGHPCPKPLKTMHWLVTKESLPGETVLDPFMGSGTTLRAAKNLGRRAIGIEIEERYCEIAAERMGQEVLDVVGV